MTPKISVIVPVYNDFFVHQACCFKGLVAQSFKDFEVIMVDDGSTHHPHINVHKDFNTVLIQTEHHGANWARNEGFKHARAHTLIFLDTDVELLPNALERMYTALGSWEMCQWVYSQFFIQRPYQNQSERTHYLSHEPSLEHLKQSNYIAMPALIKTRYFLGFDEDLDCWQDWDLWLRMMYKGIRSHFIPEPLFIHYWGRPGCITETRDHAAASKLMNDKHRFNMPIKCHVGKELIEKTVAKDIPLPFNEMNEILTAAFPLQHWDEKIAEFMRDNFNFIYKGGSDAH